MTENDGKTFSCFMLFLATSFNVLSALQHHIASVEKNPVYAPEYIHLSSPVEFPDCIN